MQMIIVTDSTGSLIGAVKGHELNYKQGDLEARVSFAPGHKIHKVEVADDMSDISDAAAFQDRLSKYLPKP